MGFIWVPMITAGLFIGMLACIEIGYQVGKRQMEQEPDPRVGTGVITTAVITILSLILGFSFAASEVRFDRRRQLIIEEANAIATAYLRLDTIPAREQPALRDLFRRYLDARLEAYAAAPDFEKAMKKDVEASGHSAQIWIRAERACREDGRESTDLLVLPAINNMIDIATARTAALRQHLPSLLVALICMISLVSSVMVGYRSSPGKRVKVLSSILFAAVVSSTFYVIMDLEHPRLGLIRLENEDRVLIELQTSLQEKATSYR